MEPFFDETATMIVGKARTQPSSGTTTTYIPDDLLQDGVRRLSFVTILLLRMTIGFVLLYNAIFIPARGRFGITGIDVAAVSLLTAMTVVIQYLARRPHWSARTVLDVGFVYQVVVAFVIGIMMYQVVPPTGLAPPMFTPIAVLIILFPIVVPATTGKVFLASMACAVMDPLTLMIMLGRGGEIPESSQVLLRLMPDLIAVGEMGSALKRTPVASWMAAATAARGGTIGTSPTPRTP